MADTETCYFCDTTEVIANHDMAEFHDGQRMSVTKEGNLMCSTCIKIMGSPDG